MEQANKLLLPIFAQGFASFGANMQKLHTINKAVAGNNNFFGGNKVKQLLVQKHCGEYQLCHAFRNIINLDKLGQVQLAHLAKEVLEIFRSNAMHLLGNVQTQHF